MQFPLPEVLQIGELGFASTLGALADYLQRAELAAQGLLIPARKVFESSSVSAQVRNDFGKQSIPARKDTYAVQKPVDFGKPESTEQQFQPKGRVVVERRVDADLHFEYAAPGHKSARYSVQHVPGVWVGDRVFVCVNDTLEQRVFIKTAPEVFVECVPTVVNQGEPIIPKEVMDVLRRYGITVGSVSPVSGT